LSHENIRGEGSHGPLSKPDIVAMALSKANRIKIMVMICSVFFVVEIVSGYYIDSLALIADAFHMV